MPQAGIDVTDEGSYDKWTVTDGSEHVIILGNEVGQTVSNVLIDQTQTGATISLKVDPNYTNDGWVIENVGWVGPQASNYHMYPRGNGRIENIFIQHYKEPDNSWQGGGGAIVTKAHAGHIDILNSYIAGMPDNGVYGSGPARDPNDGGGQGSTDYQYCYFRDNTATNYRTGFGEVRDSVSLLNDPDARRGTYDGNSRRSQAIMNLRGDNRSENCAVYCDPDDPYHDYGGAGISVQEKFDSESYVYDARHRIDGTEGVDMNSDIINPFRSVAYDGTAMFETWTQGLTTSPSFSDDVDHSPTVGVLQPGGGVPLSAEMAAKGQRDMPAEVGTAPAPPQHGSTGGGGAGTVRQTVAGVVQTVNGVAQTTGSSAPADEVITVETFDGGTMESGWTGQADWTTDSSVSTVDGYSGRRDSGTPFYRLAAERTTFAAGPEPGGRYYVTDWYASSTEYALQSVSISDSDVTSGSEDEYFVAIRFDTDTFELWQRDAGDGTVIDSQNVNLLTGTWYTCVVEWKSDGHTIVARLHDKSTGNNIATVSATGTLSSVPGTWWGFGTQDTNQHLDHVRFTERYPFEFTLEDFERATPLDDYAGDTGDFTVQGTTTLEGSASLEHNTASTSSIARTDGSVSRGNEYRYLFEMGDVTANNASQCRFYWAVQSTASIPSNTYWIHPRVDLDALQIGANISSTAESLDTISVGGFQSDTTYEVRIGWPETGGAWLVTLYNYDTGAKLGSTTLVNDAHSGGTFGFRGIDTGGPQYFDYLTERTL